MSDRIPDLGEEEHTPTRRSNALLIGAIALAVGVGGGSALLKRAVRSTGPQTPANIEVAVDSDVAPDGAALRATLLDQLVLDARIEPRPETLPAFKSFVLPCRRPGAVCEQAVERLGRADVPWRLTRAFAAALPSTANDAADRLLLPAFAGEDLGRAADALRVLRDRRRVLSGSSMDCACGFGLVRGPGEVGWLVAFAGDGTSGLEWAPVNAEGWTLDVRRVDGGPSLLRQRIVVGDPLPTIRARAGGPTAGKAEPALPSKPGH